MMFGNEDFAQCRASRKREFVTSVDNPAREFPAEFKTEKDF